MRYGLVWLGIFFCLGVGVAHGAVIDAPHNETNGIRCGNCHSYSLWWEASPVSRQVGDGVQFVHADSIDPSQPPPPPVEDTCQDEANQLCPPWDAASDNQPSPCVQPYAAVFDAVCLSCHDGSKAMGKMGHNAVSMAEMHKPLTGTWRVSCTDCHDPHLQAQLGWRGSDASSLFLVTGSLTPGSLSFRSQNNETIFSYQGADAKEAWADASLWGAKSVAGRGLILVVSRENPVATFEVKVAEKSTAITPGLADGTGTITVQGEIPLSADGATFALIYGQLVRDRVPTWNRSAARWNPARPVRFLDPNDPTGGFTDGRNPPQGICQVCHTRTSHYLNDGTSPFPHYPGSTCTRCHEVPLGFKPVYADHQGFIAEVSLCATCHIGEAVLSVHKSQCTYCHTSPPTLKDWIPAASAGSRSCTDCHAEGGNGAVVHGTTNATAAAVHDQLGALSFCATCHTAGNAEARLALHPACATCHDSTDPDVTAAIARGAAGTTLTCADCHNAITLDFRVHIPAPSGHAGVTAVAPPAVAKEEMIDCKACHKFGIIADIHKNNCQGCHLSTRPEVVAAIAAKKGHCLTCHPGTHPAFLDHHELHALNNYQNCATCHEGYTSIIEPHRWAHNNLDDSSRCTVCHVDGSDPGAILGEHQGSCLTCHLADAGVNPDRQLTILYGRTKAEGTEPSFAEECVANCVAECKECHRQKDANLGHGGHPAEHFSQAGTCESCHAGSIVSTIHQNQCATCHMDPAGNDYARVAGDQAGGVDGTALGMTVASDCLDCHEAGGGSVEAIHHNRSDGTMKVVGVAACQGCHPGEPVALHAAGGCATCHDTAAGMRLVTRLRTDLAALLTWDEAKQKGMLSRLPVTCEDCHPRPGETHAALHELTVTSKPACQACHVGNVVEEHVVRRGLSCAICHDRPSHDPPLTALASIDAALWMGGEGGVVPCSTCHDDPAVSPTGMIAAHHETTAAATGDCLACHRLGPGVDGPRKVCGSCHDHGQRFAKQHTKGPALKDIQDYRVCLSCHLAGGPGFVSGVTPVVNPLHAMPNKGGGTMPGGVFHPSDPQVSDLIPGIPPCSGMTILQDPTAYKTAHPQVNPQAIDQLVRMYPGIFTFNRLLFDQKGNAQYGNDYTDINGTCADTNPDNPGPQRREFGRDSWPWTRQALNEPSAPLVNVTIRKGGQEWRIPSLDGSGGGGEVTETGGIRVTLQPAEAVAAGAAWRVDGGAWRSSGVLASGLAAGNGTKLPRQHAIEANQVNGWARPPMANTPLAPGEEKAVTVTYAQCPTDASLTISHGGTTGDSFTLNWTDSSRAESLAVNGWQPWPTAWRLHEVQAGQIVPAQGFMLNDADGSVTLRRVGATTSGTRHLVLEAIGSSCPGHQARAELTVELSQSGAGVPLDETRGGISGEIEVRPLAGKNTELLCIAGDLFVHVADNGLLSTLFIDSNGHISPVLSQAPYAGGSSSNDPQLFLAGPGAIGILYARGDYRGHVTTVSVNPATGSLGAVIDDLDFGDAIHASDITPLTPSSSNLYAFAFHSGFSQTKNGTLATVSVSPEGQISDNLISSFIYDESGTEATILPVRGEVYALAYSGPDVNYQNGNRGMVATVRINANGAITPGVIDSWTFAMPPEEWGQGNDFIAIGDNLFATVVQDRSFMGTLRTFRIDDNGGIVKTAISHLVFEHCGTGLYDGPDIVQVADDLFAVYYQTYYCGTDIIQTYQISPETGIVTPARRGFFTGIPSYSASDLGRHPNMVQVAGDVFAMTWENDGIRTIGISGGASAPGPDHTITVAPAGGDFTDPVLALSSITDASADNTYLVRIEPGVYDLGPLAAGQPGRTLQMKPHVSVEGAGQEATILRGADLRPTSSRYDTVWGAMNSSISRLTVENVGATRDSVGIYDPYGGGIRVKDVTVRASGAGVRSRGVFSMAPSVFERVNIEVNNSVDAEGCLSLGGMRMVDTTITVTGNGMAMGATNYYGQHDRWERLTIQASGTAGMTRGIYMDTPEGSVTLVDPTIMSSTKGIEVYNGTLAVTDGSIQGVECAAERFGGTVNLEATSIEGTLCGSGFQCLNVVDNHGQPMSCP